MPSLTITYSTENAQRFAAALGKAHGLMDTRDPPQPRAATGAECKAWLIGRARQLIVDVEGSRLERERGPVVVPDVEMT
jgi:hypothetical protein